MTRVDVANGVFRGWRRKNDRVAVRNHVVILPLDDLSNAACEAVANNVKGTIAIPHGYGRLQFGEDLELFFRTLIGTGANPNVAAVVVIGIEDGWTKRVVDGIAKTGKPVEGFGIEGTGDIMTIAKASRTAKGNIAGGLTTIEEKALGNLEKIGRECRYIDVLAPAEAPAKGPGLYFMDTSSAAAECVTLMAAAGYVVHCFPTGQGNIIGNPIVPVIKITGNPKTMRTMAEHIDVDVSGILRREQTLETAGDALIGMIQRTANGRLTAAEALGHREFVITKLYRSA